MPSRTKVGLNLADKNSYVRVEENINDNLLKIDDDVDGTWGGLYGGYIQDETLTKEVGKRYIDEFNKKAYICRKPSNVNTEDAYTECNVVSNLDKLQILTTEDEKSVFAQGFSEVSVRKFGKQVMLAIDTGSGLNGKKSGDYLFTLPTGFIPSRNIAYATLNSSSRNVEIASVPLLIKNNGEVSIFATPATLGADGYYALISYTI